MAQVPLAESLNLAEQYLAIEQVRYGSRLRIAVDVTPVARTSLVPQLMLQPLVENAVRHGIGPLEQGGGIAISARVDGSRLRLSVEDDGVGVRAGRSYSRGDGLGLKGIRATLSHLYGKEHTLEVRRRELGGTIVNIDLPHRTSLS
jgi:sensor histidine kinase YesM